jgi:type VI secretion system secreted protein VgrG
MIEQAALSCEALGACVVVRAIGVEAMNALPEWTVDVLCAEDSVDLDALLGASATLGFADGGGGTRALPLLVVDAFYAGPHRDGHRFGLRLSAPASRLTLRSGYQIFQELTTQEIVDNVLKAAGIDSDAIAWRLAGQYAKRTYCVQYRETEWAFVTRLLADEGINAWFDHTEDETPRLVFGDGPSSHESIPGQPTLRFDDASGMVGSAATFFELSRSFELVHGRVELRDFDVRHPDVAISGVAGDGPLEYFEFPACVIHSEAAAARAKVRLEQLQRNQITVEGRSACARLQPGHVVGIEGAADAIFDGEHLVVEVHHEITQASRNESAGAKPYANRVVLVPFDRERAFRPGLPQGAPRIDGLETAVVTGPVGEEIHVDDLGCIKARFRWDRSGIGDDKSSRWIRCLQMAMGGSMVLPRMGWEAPIVYVDGNPDLPFALGRLYNGSAPVPYGLPGKKATTTLQSATSPSNGTTQEIRFADDAGSQEAFIHATKDQTVAVGGSNMVDVSVNETHDVKKSSVLGVKGSQSSKIGGSQTLTVGADCGVVVKGARSEAVGGTEKVGVTGTYMVICKGAYSESIAGVYGLQCNQSNTVVQGAFTQAIGGSMVITAGLGTNNSVAGARAEDVGGARSFTAATAYADSVTGPKVITAGSATDHAGTDVITKVGGVGSVQVGGSATLGAGGPLAVEAPSITIKVGGTLTAKGGSTLTIGGNVKTDGKTKFDAGTTHKSKTSKVG